MADLERENERLRERLRALEEGVRIALQSTAELQRLECALSLDPKHSECQYQVANTPLVTEGR